jgi:hypothetical protein
LEEEVEEEGLGGRGGAIVVDADLTSTNFWWRTVRAQLAAINFSSS